jgi:hypothetical protein
MPPENVPDSQPNRWTERVECEGCAETCRKWDAEAKTCYGHLDATNDADWDDEDPEWVHYCENPRHHPDFSE